MSPQLSAIYSEAVSLVERSSTRLHDNWLQVDYSLHVYYQIILDRSINIDEWMEDEPTIEDHCVLPDLGKWCLMENSQESLQDPWDISIRRYLNPKRNPQAKCTPTLMKRSRLVNGVLTVEQTAEQQEAGERCQYRCLYPIGDRSMRLGEWLPIDLNEGVQPICDVLDVLCSTDSLNSTYKYLHTQIVEQQ